MQLVELLGAGIWHTNLIKSHEGVEVDACTEQELQVGLGDAAILVGVKLLGYPRSRARKVCGPILSRLQQMSLERRQVVHIEGSISVDVAKYAERAPTNVRTLARGQVWQM